VKVLLDEVVAHKLRLALLPHDASTTVYVGWGGLKNGALLTVAEEAGFEVLVTCDKNMSYQQDMKGRKIGVVVLSAQEWPIISQHLAKIREAVDAAVPGSVQFVDCGEFRR
jgi:hypothetical protein